MTLEERKQKIEQAALEYGKANPNIEWNADAEVEEDFETPAENFEAGAIWADQNPDLYSVTRKAIEREREHLIDKICKWLDEEMEDFIEYFDEEEFPHVISSNYDYKKDFIEAFRKKLQEEQQ